MLKLTFIAVMLSAGVLAAGIGLCGEEIAHHGFQVKSEGSYQECLSCHDGVAAKEMAPCMTEICTLKSEHPVDRPYPPPTKMREYAPAAVAEMAGVKLINGRIDCISCHDLLNTNRYHLRIEDIKSRLCLTCHLK